jgi:translation elongation factor EF-G
MDRAGANPIRIIQDIKRKLGLNAAAVQIAIGSESTFRGVVDLVKMQAIYNTGEQGVVIETGPIPEDLVETARETRAELIAAIAEVDEVLSEFFIDEIDPPAEVYSLILTHRHSPMLSNGRQLHILLSRYSLDPHITTNQYSHSSTE